jgi:hypothetical protein
MVRDSTIFTGKISIVRIHDKVTRMKKEILMGLCLAALVIGILSVIVIFPGFGTNQKSLVAENSAGQKQSFSGEVPGGLVSPDIVLNTAAVQAPDQVMVYKTLPAKITKADGIVFAKKFNITDQNEPNEGDQVISVSSKDMKYRVMLFKNGGMSYDDYDRAGSPNGLDLIENLPSDEDAEKIATAFLKERDLLPDGAVFGGSKHNKAFKLNHSGGPATVDREDILLGYTRELNGMKVEGTQYMVEVGAHGDIISFFTNWKDYEPAGNYSIKSGASAFEELSQKGVAAGSLMNKPDTISIDTMYLAYHTQAAAYKEYYLEPVWVFKGRALLANGTTVDSVNEYIPALTNDSVQSISLKLE